MIQYYLNGQPTDPPEGVDAIRFVRRRHRTYFGFLYQKLGLVEGIGNLAFRQPVAVNLLRSAYAKDGLLAEVSYRIEQDGFGVLYDGCINFETYVYQQDEQGGSVSVMLRDDRRVVDLDMQAQTMFSLAADTNIRLHARRLAGSAAMELDTARAVVSVKRKDAAVLAHSVPLRQPATSNSDKGSLPGTLAGLSEPLTLTPCYTNTSAGAQLLHITGTVAFTGSTEQNSIVGLALETGDDRLPIARLGLTTVNKQQLAVIDQTIRVLPGAELRLLMRTETAVTGYSFSYDVLTAVQFDATETVPDSYCTGILAGNLLARLVARCSPDITLRSDFFSRGLPARLHITNGALLRAISLPIQTSLATTFGNLSALFSLYMGFDRTGTLRIEDRASLRTNRRTTQIRQLLSYSEKPCAERLFSEVLAGYSNWQGSSAGIALDVNTARRYLAPLTRLRNVLNLQCSWVGSGAMIEEQRRKQFSGESATAGKADSQDSALYVIVTAGRAGQLANERLENVAGVSGLIDPGNAYNLAIAPGRSLANWAAQLRPCLPLTLEESATRQTVAFSYEDSYTDETAGLSGVRSNPVEALFGAPMSASDFYQLGDWIVLPTGVEGLLMDAVWQQGAAGGVATLTIWPDWQA